MHRFSRLMSCGALLAVIAYSPAQAEERGSLDEAQAMSEAAAAYLEAEGAEMAYPAFNEGAEWHDRDLYVFVFGSDGTVLAHGANADLIGENLIEATDATGNTFVADFVAVDDHAWIDYDFADPQTGAILPKRSYIMRVGDDVVGVGAYVTE